MVSSIASVSAYIAQPTGTAASGYAADSTSANSSNLLEHPLFSAYTIQVDPLSHLAIFEKRNPETGDVTQQYPSATVVDEYRKISEGQASPASIAAADALGADIPQSAIQSTISTDTNTATTTNSSTTTTSAPTATSSTTAAPVISSVSPVSSDSSGIVVSTAVRGQSAATVGVAQSA
jgi:hypothetical protein